jgi:DNA-binding transcriptional ArsR family regulator
VGFDFRVHPFQLMSEPIRRRIVEILASGEHTAGEVSDAIVGEFAVTPSAVSRHLRILRENHVVIVRAEWVNRLYRLDPHFIPRLRGEVRHLQELWKRRVGVMARDDDPHAHPVQIPLWVGERKGKRGKLHRDDVWRRA